MIDNGQAPLAKIDGFGNFWHGSKTFAGVYKSRAGASMPGLNTGNLPVVVGAAAHLVDFGMPTVSTLASEVALGMDRWRKAVLHGKNKRYAIASNKEFGADGWPYRATDGTVFFLRAVCDFASPNHLTITAIKLKPDFTRPTTVIGSITVPTLTGCDAINAAPDGHLAAAHSWQDYQSALVGDTAINWIVDITVSGGSSTDLPGVSLSLTYTTSNAMSNLDGTSPTVPARQVGATEVITWQGQRKITTRTPAIVLSGGSPVAVWSSSMVDVVCMVVFDASGGRHVISRGSGWKTQIDNFLEFTAIQPEIWWDDGAPNPAVRVQNGAYSYKVDNYSWQRLRISVDGTPVVTIEAVSLRQDQMDATSMPEWSSPNLTILSNTTTGNAIGPSGNCLTNGEPLRFRLAASNVLVLLDQRTSWALLGYATAQSHEAYTYTSPLALTSNDFPAWHPETGALNPAISLYF